MYNWMKKLKTMWYLDTPVSETTEMLQQDYPHTTEKMVQFWYDSFDKKAAL